MPRYYAIKRGRDTGIVKSWAECGAWVTGFPGAIYKSFRTVKEAEAFLLDDDDTCCQRSLTKEEKSKIRIKLIK